MERTAVGIILNGVTGRMGYRQHLVRSLLAIREQGGLPARDGSRIWPELTLVGRNEAKLAEIAARHGLTSYTTDLDAALADDSHQIYFDAQVTAQREKAVRAAIDAGMHVYTEKPLAEGLTGSLELGRLAAAKGIKNGVVQDKLFLPGLRKLKRLVDGGFFGRILSVRGEFGYWVFEGDWQDAQRPSWNYRAEDGGGITAQINSSWTVRVYRDELVEFQVDGTHGSAVAGLRECRIQHRGATPMPVWNPDLPLTENFRGQWQSVPDNEDFDNGFKVQWEAFLRHVVDDEPFPWDFLAGARGVQLAEASLLSAREGRRVEIENITL
ncbi:Gfo/Idh/MocA family protein [Dactylosporangium sp. CA-233914]|uniref:Gfo/Idh/MocA family protein n=1 Tax=Dactylosporangium sp. CA-233914 TaxID=3239934 RepID=UPI003D8D5570